MDILHKDIAVEFIARILPTFYTAATFLIEEASKLCDLKFFRFQSRNSLDFNQEIN